MGRSTRDKYFNMQHRLICNSVEVDGHWLWLGNRSRDGYGRLGIWTPSGPRTVWAHRLSYAAFKGEVPEGHDVDHAPGCPRECIAPDHLTAVPYLEHRLKTGIHIKNRGKRIEAL